MYSYGLIQTGSVRQKSLILGGKKICSRPYSLNLFQLPLSSCENPALKSYAFASSFPGQSGSIFNGSNSYTLCTSGYSSVFATYPSLGTFELSGNISFKGLPALKFPTGAPFLAASFFPPISRLKYLNLLFKS